MSDILRKIVARNRAGEVCAIPSVCSAHPDVLRASLMLAEALDRPVVIEATSNQVNQDGGYTGMTPADFIGFVHGIADAAGVARGRIVFGGDHLGPQAWRKGPADQAMAKARVMVADYVRAGFGKIHLDCSEGCAGEPAQLGDTLAAARAADLAGAALAATDDPASLIFVIGTEVPPPGGARSDEHGDITPTTPASAAATLTAHAAAFRAAGLGHVLPQIGGLVVQPGVEFSPMEMHYLPQGRDPQLRAVLTGWPQVCLEAHSTDYQQDSAFVRLAELGFAFQKVGPALTFAYRQAVYALDTLRRQAGWASSGPLPEVMESLMLAQPAHWQGHYRGDSGDIRVERHFGLADRIRYYWPQPEAQAAVAAVLRDLEGRALPDPMLLEAFPAPVIARAHEIGGALPQALIYAAIQMALRPYFLDSAAGFGKEPRR
jgi:D-tagatose-1,6-bisphosphate aldolase subunit GatZ/KbaZ